MTQKSRFVTAAIALTALTAVSFAAAPANAAVVYCKTAGIPQGCVVRPAPVVVAPVARVGYAYDYRYRAPVTVHHVGYTRVTPYGVRHVGHTRVWR